MTAPARRVIVTRAAEKSGPLVDGLRRFGIEVVEMPLTRTVDAPDGGAALRDAVANLSTYDWVVATSPEGARRLRLALDTASPDDTAHQDTSRPRYAAVGRATAEALGGADLVPTVQTGAALGEAFPDGPGRVLLAVARDAGTDFERAAAAKGWVIDRIATYVTEPVPFTASEIADRRAVIADSDAVVMAAPSAVQSWVAAFGSTVPAVVVAMGPSTAEALTSAGFPCTVATEQSLEGLVRAVVQALGLPAMPPP
ncbi:MAG: uroporphyrinogen-III synthase [Actinomycetota bacterium]